MGNFRRAVHEKADMGSLDSKNESIGIPMPAISMRQYDQTKDPYLAEVILKPTATFSQYKVTVALVSPSGTI